MNAIDLLKQDHDAVEEMFARCESTPPSKHEATVKRIKAELDTHAHIEEKIFYPACRERGNKELRDIIAEGVEEHAQMKKFLKEIARSTSTEKREAKLKVLIEDTRHHVKEEENEMFPLVEEQFTADELETMGERMEAEKKKFQKSKRITPRRQPPKGVVATVMEKAMELVSSVTGAGTTAEAGTKRPRAKAANGRSKPANGGGAKRSSTAGSGSKKAQASKGGSAKGTSRSKAPASR